MMIDKTREQELTTKCGSFERDTTVVWSISMLTILFASVTARST